MNSILHCAPAKILTFGSSRFINQVPAVASYVIPASYHPWPSDFTECRLAMDLSRSHNMGVCRMHLYLPRKFYTCILNELDLNRFDSLSQKHTCQSYLWPRLVGEYSRIVCSAVPAYIVRIRKETRDEAYWAPLERQSKNVMQAIVVSCYKPFRKLTLDFSTLHTLM